MIIGNEITIGPAGRHKLPCIYEELGTVSIVVRGERRKLDTAPGAADPDGIFDGQEIAGINDDSQYTIVWSYPRSKPTPFPAVYVRTGAGIACDAQWLGPYRPTRSRHEYATELAGPWTELPDNWDIPATGAWLRVVAIEIPEAAAMQQFDVYGRTDAPQTRHAYVGHEIDIWKADDFRAVVENLDTDNAIHVQATYHSIVGEQNEAENRPAEIRETPEEAAG